MILGSYYLTVDVDDNTWHLTPQYKSGEHTWMTARKVIYVLSGSSFCLTIYASFACTLRFSFDAPTCTVLFARSITHSYFHSFSLANFRANNFVWSKPRSRTCFPIVGRGTTTADSILIHSANSSASASPHARTELYL